jgi:ParB-like nuclease domain
MTTKLEYETWPIDELTEYANNPRKNDHAIDKIAEAIRFFGFRIPIIIQSDGTVVDGHLRLKAARKLGMTEIPVVLADDLTDEQVRAFRISVNRMAELADWDADLLSEELRYLQSTEFDLSLLGFDLSAIKDLTESSFKPNYQPGFSSKEISENDFLNAQDKMNDALVSGYEKKQFIEVECPHCATKMTIEKK